VCWSGKLWKTCALRHVLWEKMWLEMCCVSSELMWKVEKLNKYKYDVTTSQSGDLLITSPCPQNPFKVQSSNPSPTSSTLLAICQRRDKRVWIFERNGISMIFDKYFLLNILSSNLYVLNYKLFYLFIDFLYIYCICPKI
jgi:hypothetical protein